MSETQPQAPNQYLVEHPGAVQDVEKAHTLALMNNELETQAVGLRTEAVQKLGELSATGDGYTVGRDAESEIKRVHEKIDERYNRTSGGYDKVMGTKR